VTNVVGSAATTHVPSITAGQRTETKPVEDIVPEVSENVATGQRDRRENREFRRQLPGGRAPVPGHTGHGRVQMDRVHRSSDRLSGR